MKTKLAIVINALPGSRAAEFHKELIELLTKQDNITDIESDINYTNNSYIITIKRTINE